MTLAKTCHASNMMQALVEATDISSQKLSESRCFHCSIIELEENCTTLILKLEVATLNE